MSSSKFVFESKNRFNFKSKTDDCESGMIYLIGVSLNLTFDFVDSRDSLIFV